MPVLRDYALVNWVRIKGGVYSYIEKILERFKGDIQLNVEIAQTFRSADAVKIVLSNGESQEFDKVVFAMPPDQVMRLLSDPTDGETKRFSAWKANYATTVLHSDTSMYDRYSICKLSEFDFFETDKGWGYNASLNQLCGISSPRQYSLAFQLQESIAQKDIRPLAKINRTGKMPIPQELFCLVGWASCPPNKFMKRTFARGLLFTFRNITRRCTLSSLFDIEMKLSRVMARTTLIMQELIWGMVYTKELLPLLCEWQN